MSTEKPAYEELERRLKEAEDTLKAIRSGAVDVVIGDKATLLLRVKEAEDELKKEKEKYRHLSQEFNALLDAIPDSLTLQDRDLTILWANKGAAAVLGKRPEDIIGQRCYNLWYNRDKVCEKECFIVKSFETGKPVNQTTTTSDGKIWDLRAVPIANEKNEIINVIAVGRDITEHRNLEDQLRQAQKLEAIGTLAGGVAHDFNNILTAIIGYSNLLLMKLEDDDPNRHSVEQILSASERATHLTQGLLAFSRRQIVNPTFIDLNELILSFGKLLRRLLPENIEMRTALSKETLTVFADKGQIEQVIMNLVTNARDVMPKGGILTIETRIEKLDEHFIHAHGYGSPGDYAMISVTDTGTGMDKTTMQKIFEPFFTTKEQGKGTGLGLAMVYGIVKKHEGFINVYSEPGRGSTFKVYIPLAKSAEPVKQDTEESYEPVHGGSETILVAEDDPELLKLISFVLRHYGYTVIEATNGEEAIEKFIESKDSIKLIILDGIMPKKNGKEAYEAIKAIDPDVQAIFMSGYAEDVFAKDGIIKSGLIFLQKPVSPTDIARKAREVLDQ